MNMANASGSFASGNFIDLQTNTASKFKVDYNGALTIAASSVATSSSLNIGALTGATANTAINIGNLSGAATNTGINIGNLSTGTNNTGIKIGTLTAAAGSNQVRGLQMGTLTAVASVNNYSIDLGAITTVAGATAYSINTGGFTAAAGTATYGINLGTNTSTATTKYGLNIGSISGAGTNSYGININPIYGATNNYGINYAAASGVTILNAQTGINLDLSTNYTNVTQAQTGMNVALKGASAANAINTKGINISSGAYVNSAGTSTWTGLDITMPAITQTAGALTSRGIRVQGGTVTSGTSYAITTDATAGNVGIGTLTPTGALHVEKTSAGANWAYFNNNTGSSTPNYSSGLAVGWNNSNGGGEVSLVARKAGGSTGGFEFQNWDGATLTDLVVITETGNVGIRVNTPTAYSRLQIAAGDANTAQINLAAQTDKSANFANGDLWYDGTELNFRTGGSTVNLLAGSASGWTDGGTVVYTTTSTDNVTVGTNTDIGKLGIIGDTDEIQLRVRANATQTNNMFQIENSAGTTNYLTVSTTAMVLNGNFTFATGAARTLSVQTQAIL